MIERMDIKQKIITGMMIILALLLWSNTPAYAQTYQPSVNYFQYTPPAYMVGNSAQIWVSQRDQPQWMKDYQQNQQNQQTPQTQPSLRNCSDIDMPKKEDGSVQESCYCNGATCQPGDICFISATVRCQKPLILEQKLAPSCVFDQKATQFCRCELFKNSDYAMGCNIGQYCVLPLNCSDIPPCPTGGTTAATESCTCMGYTCSAGQYCSATKHCVNEETPDPEIRADLEKLKEKCLPRNYYDSYEGCLFCPLFRVVFNASSQMTKLAIDKLSSPIYHLVILAFALWIALEVLKLVSSPETKDIKDFFAATINKAFVVLLVVIVLQNGAADFMNLALDPIFNTGMKIAEETLSPEKMNDTGQDKTTSITCEKDSQLTNEGALPNSMGNSILCVMRLVQNSAAKVAAIGSATMCASMSDDYNFLYFIPHFGLLLTGFGFWLGAMLIIIGVPWMMLDCVVQLAVAGMMLPAAIGFYAFKPTRRYTKPVWNSFLSTMFNFLFMSLMVLMLMAAFDVIMDDTAGKEISQYVLSNDFDFDAFLDKMGWFTMPFLKIVFVLLLIWALLPEAMAFADSFASGMMQTSSSGGKPNIGSKIGTMGASLTKSVFQRTALPIGKAAGKVGWGWTKNAGKAAVHGVRRGITSIQKNRTKKYGTAKTNADGSTTYTRTSKRWFGLGGTRTTSYTVGGNSDETLNVTTKYKKLGIRGLRDAETTKQKGDLYTISTKKVRNRKTGQMEIVQDGKIRYNSSDPKKLFNQKGEIKTAEFTRLMNSSDDQVKAATLKTIMQQRLQGRNDIVNNSNSIKTELLKDRSGNVTGYREYLKNGTVRDMHFSIKGNRIKTDFTELDKKGNGVRLSTDGVINRKQTFKAQVQRDANGNITSVKPDAKSVKTTYGLTKYYERYRRQHRNNKIDYQNSMFSQREIKEAQNFMAGNHYWQNANMYEFDK